MEVRSVVRHIPQHRVAELVDQLVGSEVHHLLLVPQV